MKNTNAFADTWFVLPLAFRLHFIISHKILEYQTILESWN